MASVTPSFLDIWRVENIRKRLFKYLDVDALCVLRLTALETCSLSTSTLFTRVQLTFTASALSKPSRIEALARIGHHIQHLTFSMPHTDATFLPPLINPISGREILFLYTPHTSITSSRPHYGTEELGDVLTQQYPPIFHAATNVPSFIRTMSCMPNLRHLTVSCPGQEPTHRYRRSVVDYALISLRIAIERANLVRLEKLSMYLHSSGLLYFRHMPGFGSTPAAGRRWRQIKKLKLTIDSWDFETNPLDHLKLLDDYIRSFSKHLEKLSFTWNGLQGPCPLTLSEDPLFAPPRKTAKLFAEVTSPMSPLPAAPPRPAIKFPKLRYMRVRNAAMSAKQVEDLVCEHRHTVREFDFEDVTMTAGSWVEAFDPLSRRRSGSECWQSQYSGSSASSDGDSFRTCTSNPNLRGDEDLRLEEPLFPSEAAVAPPTGQQATTKLRKRRLRRRRRQPDENPHSEKYKTQTSLPLPSISTLTISAPILPNPLHLQPTVFNPDPSIQGVQRDWAQEAAQQELVDDPDKRVQTLRKAREAVLERLGSKFRRGGGGGGNGGNGTSGLGIGGGRQSPISMVVPNRDTMACRRALGGLRGRGAESTGQLVPLMIFR